MPKKWRKKGTLACSGGKLVHLPKFPKARIKHIFRINNSNSSLPEIFNGKFTMLVSIRSQGDLKGLFRILKLIQSYFLFQVADCWVWKIRFVAKLHYFEY